MAFIAYLSAIVLLIGLPLLGLAVGGKPIPPYLAFPPSAGNVSHAPFSWPIFAGYALLILCGIIFLFLLYRPKWRVSEVALRPSLFPWWGWIGIGLVGIAWCIAWTRFSWFHRFQTDTFTPLWLGYIIAINGWTFARKGSSLLTNQRTTLLLLFPLSAFFWWFFEYLNRFVENWSYTGACFQAWAYFWRATISFSTVLPAFASTREWLLTWPWIDSGFKQSLAIHCPHPRILAWLVLIISLAGLFGIGIWPNALFPVLWISPLLLILSLQGLFGKKHLFSAVSRGDWRLFASSALAALMCGFFWEMWNYLSLAKWEYNVPFVHGFQIFEMPLLGYAGYFPFGLECAILVSWAGVRIESI
jgi:hypothetical protein